jgi:hypothetical protein
VIQNDSSTTNNELQRDLGRVEGKIDGITATLAVIQADKVRCYTDRGDLGERINKVQNKQYWFAGLAAAAGIVIGKFGSLLFH